MFGSKGGLKDRGILQEQKGDCAAPLARKIMIMRNRNQARYDTAIRAQQLKVQLATHQTKGSSSDRAPPDPKPPARPRRSHQPPSPPPPFPPPTPSSSNTFLLPTLPCFWPFDGLKLMWRHEAAKPQTSRLAGERCTPMDRLILLED